MRSPLIVIIDRVDCRKYNLAGRTLSNLFSQFEFVVWKEEGEKIKFSTKVVALLLAPSSRKQV